MTEYELQALLNQNKRKSCWEDVKDTMFQSISGERSKGKGSLNRKKFLTWLRVIKDTTFIDDDEEYKYINKFGRGMWDEKIFKSFNKDEQKLIFEVIAKEYGAYNY